MIKVLILDGGKSLRMGGKPKCLTFVGGKTVLTRQLDWLSKYGIQKSSVVISVGVNKELVDVCHTLGLKCFSESTPLGDGGAIRYTVEKYISKEDCLLVLNGDLLLNFDLQSFLSEAYLLKDKNLVGIVAATQIRLQVGVLSPGAVYNESTTTRKLVRFVEKPILHDMFCSCGVYLLSSRVKECITSENPVDFARDVIQQNIEKFGVHVVDVTQWFPVETEKDVLLARDLVYTWSKGGNT